MAIFSQDVYCPDEDGKMFCHDQKGEKCLTSIQDAITEIQKLRQGPLVCALPKGSKDGDPCPAGCPPDGICRAVYLRKSEAISATKEIQEKDAEIQSLRDKVAARDGRIEAMQGIIQSLRERVKERDGRIEAMQGIIQSLRERVKELEGAGNKMMAALWPIEGDNDVCGSEAVSEWIDIFKREARKLFGG